MTILNFDSLEPQTLQFKIGATNYLLEEPSEGVAADYKSQQLLGTAIENGKVVGVNRLPEAKTYLLSRCLRKDGGSGIYTPVSLEEVKALPSRITSKLHKWLDEVGEVGEELTKEEIERQIQHLQAKLAILVKSGETTLPKVEHSDISNTSS